nr:hypothetical protein [uncultured Fluviicola sp.]
MKDYLLFIILSLFVLRNSFGQCDRDYPKVFYHNSNIVTDTGDTINKWDSSGLYEGLHLYTNEPGNLYNDTLSYTIGNFHHGKPVGDWKDHCADGTYAVGVYAHSKETSSDGKGGWITKPQGISNRIGIWKCYDSKGVLLETLLYERMSNDGGWTDKKFLMDSTGKFILIKYNFNSNNRLDSRFKRQKMEEYSEKEILLQSNKKGLWKNLYCEYSKTGILLKKTKEKKFFGKSRNIKIVTEYDFKGRFLCKTKMRRRYPDLSVMGVDF